MISLKIIGPRELETVKSRKTWGEMLYQIAKRNFNHVPYDDITHLIKNAANANAVIHVAFNDKKPAGFGVVLHRQFIIKNNKTNYMVFDVGCLDAGIRRQHVYALATLTAMLRFKLGSLKRLFHKAYVLAIFMTPASYQVYQLPYKWIGTKDLNPKQRDLFEALLKAHANEFDLAYKGCGYPIQFKTWLPCDTGIDLNYNSIHSHIFLEKNPNWQEGYGLPVVFPLGWRNIFTILMGLILIKCRRKR
jgi:hypothetical protein